MMRVRGVVRGSGARGTCWSREGSAGGLVWGGAGWYGYSECQDRVERAEGRERDEEEIVVKENFSNQRLRLFGAATSS